MSDYEDILNLPHHVSDRRPRMSMEDRAAQFSPFAALTGYGEAVRETARLTEERPEPDEEALAILDGKFRLLMRHLGEPVPVRVEQFVPDGQKDGGACVTVRGTVRKVSLSARELVLEDGRQIPLGDILDLDSPLFDREEPEE